MIHKLQQRWQYIQNWGKSGVTPEIWGASQKFGVAFLLFGNEASVCDCNIMKVYLCDALKKYDFVFDKDKDKQNIQALKTGNCYRVITSEHLKFLDYTSPRQLFGLFRII